MTNLQLRKVVFWACAIEPASIAHQWRRLFCAIEPMRLRQKLMAQGRVISLLPTAHQWRNGAPAASKKRTAGGRRSTGAPAPNALARIQPLCSDNAALGTNGAEPCDRRAGRAKIGGSAGG